jgi:sugar phosphate permease
MSIWNAFCSRLIDDWHRALKLWSIRINAAGAIILPLLTMVPALPAEIQALFPPAVRAIIAALWCVAAIAARLVKQKPSA